jgi:hypothetical protein
MVAQEEQGVQDQMEIQVMEVREELPLVAQLIQPELLV